ncbi:hypothetical protein RI367_008367 [Sorochytrium milnesiophthora]
MTPISPTTDAVEVDIDTNVDAPNVTASNERKPPRRPSTAYGNDRPFKEVAYASVGPSSDTHIETSNLWQRSLHVLCAAWLAGGASFLIAVVTCFVYTVSYGAFGVQGGTVSMIAATYHCYVLIRWALSVIRTGARILVSVWTFKITGPAQDDGASGALDYINRGSRMMARFSLMRSFTDAQLETPYVQHAILRRKSYASAALKALPVAIIFGPPIILSAKYGVDTVVGAISLTFTMTAVGTLVLVNTLARISRTVYFLRVLSHDISRARLRAMFLATIAQGKETRNAYGDVSTAIVMSLVYVLISCLIFNTFAANSTQIIIVGVVAGVLLLLRFQRMIHDVWHWFIIKTPTIIACHYPISVPKRERFYNGHARTPLVALLLIRHVWLIVGLACLVYTDVNMPVVQYDPTDTARTPLVPAIGRALSLQLLAVVLYGLMLLRDAVFLGVSVPALRALIMAVTHLLQILVTCIIMISFSGTTSVAVIFITLLTLDYRDGRYFWTSNNNDSLTASAVVGAEDAVTLQHIKRERTVTAVTILAVLAAIVMAALALAYTSVDPVKDSASVIPDASVLSQLGLPRNIDTRPTMCNIKLDNSLSLDLLDYAVLAEAAELTTTADINTLLQASHSLNSYTIAFSTLGQAYGGRYFDFYDSTTNTSIVVIRGTSTLEDVLQDLYLWATPALLQTSSYFGTYVNLWSEEAVASAVYYIAQYVTYPNLAYHIAIEQYVRSIVNARARVQLVGHSLGGGLAQALGGKLGLPAIGFSAPGLGYTREYFGVDEVNLNKFTFNVVPLRDPVPEVDLQRGTVVHIPCNQTSSLTCHRIKATVRTLLSLC